MTYKAFLPILLITSSLLSCRARHTTVVETVRHTDSLAAWHYTERADLADTLVEEWYLVPPAHAPTVDTLSPPGLYHRRQVIARRAAAATTTAAVAVQTERDTISVVQGVSPREPPPSACRASPWRAILLIVLGVAIAVWIMFRTFVRGKSSILKDMLCG